MGAPHPGPLPTGEREDGIGELLWGEGEVIAELGDGEAGIGEEVQEGGLALLWVCVADLRRREVARVWLLGREEAV